MSRPIGFDLDRAIERATLVFWRKGYSNTSLRDLLTAMGIGEGSFYNTVGSKKHLYELCLKHYNDTVSRRRLAALTSGATVGDGVRAFFRTVLDELDDPKTPRLCLMARSLSTDVLAERDLKIYVVGEMAAFVRVFEQRLRSAVAKGELPKRFPVETTGQVLVTYLQGMFRVIRVLNSRAEVERQIEALVQGLGL